MVGVGIYLFSCTSVLQIWVYCTVALSTKRFLELFYHVTVLVPENITDLLLLFLPWNVLDYELLQHILI